MRHHYATVNRFEAPDGWMGLRSSPQKIKRTLLFLDRFVLCSFQGGGGYGAMILSQAEYGGLGEGLGLDAARWGVRLLLQEAAWSGAGCRFGLKFSLVFFVSLQPPLGTTSSRLSIHPEALLQEIVGK